MHKIRVPPHHQYRRRGVCAAHRPYIVLVQNCLDRKIDVKNQGKQICVCVCEHKLNQEI